MTAGGVTGASALLAACSNPLKATQNGTSPGASGAPINPALDLARPDNPVTLPVDKGLIIASGQKTTPSAMSGTTLNVYNWVDYINPRIVGKLFPEQTGININLSTFNTMDEAISKLTTTNENYDVLMGLTKDVVGRLVDAKLLRPLNHDYLPNLQNVWSSFFTTKGSFWDVGQQYTVPYTVYTTGIGYRIDHGPTSHIQMNLSPLETQIPQMSNPYEIFWDATYKGFVNLLDDYREVTTMALLKNGVTGVAGINTDDPSTRNADLKKAEADLLDLVHTMNPKFDNDDYTELPEASCYIHQSWSGDLTSVQYYYPSWSNHDMIRYWYPPSGLGAVGGDHNVILTNGKNPLAAHVFLNWLLDFDNAMVNFVWNGYVPPMTKVTSPDQLVKGSSTPLTGKYGSYAIVPPELANTTPMELQYNQGWAELELSPSVDVEWKQIYEAVQTA
jgi:spermidine/putrescine transport system substrate-binding protein